MDGKRRLLNGIILGALIGGLTSLCNKEARNYAKDKISQVKNNSSYYIKNPSQGVSQLRGTFDKWNKTIVSNTENTLNALEQVEETIHKLTKK